MEIALSRSMLGGFRRARHPLHTRNSVPSLEFVDGQIGTRIDDLCSQVETAIERLQECRTALVTAAVTGKIDVRER